MQTFKLFNISHKTSGEFWRVSASSPEDALDLINVNEKRNLEMKDVFYVDKGSRLTFGAVLSHFKPAPEKS